MNKFNQFMMVNHPDYLRLSAEEQTKYRLEHQNELGNAFTRFILNTEFNYNLKSDEEIHFIMPSHEELIAISKYRCYLKGIGKNYLHAYDTIYTEDLTIFDSLYDYACKKTFAEDRGLGISETVGDYKEDPSLYFLGSMSFGSIERIDGSDTYRDLCVFSLPEYINITLMEAGLDKLNKLIPSQRIRGKDHGKPAEGGLIYHSILQADGYEKEHQDLDVFIHNYLANFQDTLYRTIEENSHKCVWKVDLTDHPERCYDYIIPNAEVAKKIKIESWYEDTEKLLGDNQELDKILTKYINEFSSAIDQKYKELMDKHCPDVIYLNKDRKMVLPEFMFDDLDRG